MSPQLQDLRQRAKAAFMDRIVAFIIDGFAVGVVSWIVTALLFPFGYGYGGGGFFVWPIWWGLFFVYKLFMESSSGQTFGKMLMHLKVVREDGGPISMKEAQPRAFATLLYIIVIPILLDLMYVSDEGQSLGDRWAHTAVIKVP